MTNGTRYRPIEPSTRLSADASDTGKQRGFSLAKKMVNELSNCFNRNDWGAIILVDDRYFKQPQKYSKGEDLGPRALIWW